ncbi:ubiquitin-conjugating enzyme E2 D [Sarotherodon galilaeus]
MDVYKQIHAFLLNGELPPTEDLRRKIRRMAPNYKLKDNRLFYTGPSMQCMRLVVMSEEEKKSVLMECHNNPGTGNHNGVSAIMTSKLYTFGMVRKIITDQGKEFVNQLNNSIFSMLNIKHAVSSAYHPQTNGQDERTNQNIKRALRKYVNQNHDDWDVHLAAVVYGINTAKQHSTRHSPYFLLFHRHPRLPAVMNACPMDDEFEVANPEEDIDTRVEEMTVLNETVLRNIERAQDTQKKTFGTRKRKQVRQCVVQAGDDVLLSGDPKRRRIGDALLSQHQGPYTVASITPKGVATIVKGATCQKVNVSRLRNYHRSKNPPTERKFLLDHSYGTPEWQIDHQYASPGAKWQKDLEPLQSSLLEYVLDQNRPPGELLVKEGNICLTREDFWSLGLEHSMESTIGNACLKIVGEAAQRHGKDVHIADLYVVATWKDPQVNLLRCLPDNFRSKDILLFPAWSRYLKCGKSVKVSQKMFIFFLSKFRIFGRVAAFIDSGSWMEKTGRDLEFFPQQCNGNCCGIFMLMYALCISTSSPLSFTEEDMPAIRLWWCIQLMERFCIEGHGQRFAFWTEEASLLLQGTLQPVFRVPKATSSKPSPSLIRQADADRCPILELPACVLIDILEEVVLHEGDTAIFKLALVCSMFRDLVSTEYFRRRAHFKWLHSVCTWSSFSEKYKEQYFNMYTIEICLQCGDQYKHCPRGYVGTDTLTHNYRKMLRPEVDNFRACGVPIGFPVQIG